MKTRYAIIRDTDPQVFTNQVNAAMKDGWVPVGGVALVVEPRSVTPGKEPGETNIAFGLTAYCQAMIIRGVNGIEIAH